MSNFENVGCFYAIERMRGIRVGEISTNYVPIKKIYEKGNIGPLLFI
jgi:hypothetical protein